MLTLAAFYFHPDLDVARASYAIARAGVITAGARPNPVLFGGAEYTTDAEENVSPWTLGFSLDVPIEIAGKRGYRIDRARKLADADRLKIATAAWTVRSRLRRSFIDLDTARESVSLLTKQREIQAEIAEMLRKRLDYGEASLPDLTQAQITLSQVELQLHDAERRREEGRVDLATSVGLPVKALDGISLSPGFVGGNPSHDLLDRERLQREALTRRADLLGLLAEYAAAESALRLEIARQFPDVHIVPGYRFDQGLNKWGLGFSVALPIFDRNQGPIAEAEARRRQTATRVEALQERTIGDLNRASASYREALRKLETADVLLASQTQQAQQAETRFRAGEADRLELRSAELQTGLAALARLEALASAQQALGALEDAVQLPLDQAESALPAPERVPRFKENSR